MNVSDDNTGYMAPALSNLFNDAHSEALIVSPYFIPGDAGVASLKRWINTGVQCDHFNQFALGQRRTRCARRLCKLS